MELLTTLCAALWELIKLLIKDRELLNELLTKGFKLRLYWEIFKSDYFYDEKLVKWFLSNRDLTKLPKTDFIDYPVYLNYYTEDIKSESLSVKGKSGKRKLKEIRMPYKEEINFVNAPTTKILVEGQLSFYQMSDELRDLTERNFRDYINSKKLTNPHGTILRVSNLKRVNKNLYECSLERSTYEFQARTNLTLDYTLEPPTNLRGKFSHYPTLRLMDMNESRNLRPLNESILVNSLGVSAVVYYQKGRHRFFFMKLRKDSNGVFENMLSTVSGVVQIPQGQRVSDLISYGSQEIRRELSRETGLDDAIKGIQPLAFVRELTRGGKPQLFFLIEIKCVDNKDFKRLFQNSVEGLQEFYDSLLKNKASIRGSLSPEFMANLVYTFQFFQKRERQNESPIMID